MHTGRLGGRLRSVTKLLGSREFSDWRGEGDSLWNTAFAHDSLGNRAEVVIRATRCWRYMKPDFLHHSCWQNLPAYNPVRSIKPSRYSWREEFLQGLHQLAFGERFVEKHFHAQRR